MYYDTIQENGLVLIWTTHMRHTSNHPRIVGGYGTGRLVGSCCMGTTTTATRGFVLQ